MSKTSKKALIFLLTTLLMLYGASALAGTAFPGAVGFTEPATDERVQILNHGDEHFSYMSDPDGYLLVEDESGYLRYVAEDSGVFVLGGYVTQENVGTTTTRINVNASVSDFQSKLQALMSEIAANRPTTFGLTSSVIPLDYDFVGDRAEGRAQVCTTEEDNYLDDPANYPAMESTCPLLVLKVQFKDIKCIFSDAAWHDRVFENGITQYYQAVSNGKFTYVPVEETAGKANDGVVTITLPFDCPRYTIVDGTTQLVQDGPAPGLYRGDDGYNYALYNIGSIYAYAMLAAESSVDFNSFDRNDDGFINPTELAVLVVFSGYEASFGGAVLSQGQPAAWAHSWKYNNITLDRADEDCHYMTMEVGGKRVTKYTVIGELANYAYDDAFETNPEAIAEMYDYDTGAGTPRQAQYGTASHELGHDMGLPDLYPTGDPDPSPTQEVNGLSLMAGGSWGKKAGEEPGSTPTHLDPMSKLFLGFYDAVETDSTGKYTLYATEPSAKYNILRVNTDDPNVYYLIENRELTGYDEGLYLFYGPNTGGLVIWRVDQEVLSSHWRMGGVNNEEGHYGLMPIFVDADTYARNPFWKLDSVPNFTTLGDPTQFTLSSLSLPSAAMELQLQEAPSITSQPTDAYVVEGQTASFAVTATGTGLTYQWYADLGKGWTKLESATKAQLDLADTKLASDGFKYRCVVTDSFGVTAQSNEATLHVSAVIVPPNTGDSQQPLFYAALLALSFAGLLALRLRGKAARR